MAGTILNPNDATAIVEFTVNEDSAFELTAQLKDLDDSDLLLTELDTITLTLFLTRGGTTSPAGTIINSRDAEDIKNTGDVVISADGLLTWDVQPEDTAIINDEIEVCENVMKNTREVHRALFEWTKTVAAGGEQGKKRVDLIVCNLAEVP
jgi:hypothetical protein